MTKSETVAMKRVYSAFQLRH